MKSRSDPTRQRILEAACRTFAECGYEGAPVQQIARRARVTKPALYYYFGSKAGLYQAVVDGAYDERFALMQRAVAEHQTTEDRLVGMLDALFRFAREKQDLTRLCFATAFAARGEIPNQQKCFRKGKRNFELVHKMIEQGIAAGELDGRFGSRQLTSAIFSQVLFYAITQAVKTRHAWKHPAARDVVRLFLRGAAARRTP